MTPETFAAPINEWASDTMIAAHGTRFVSAGGGRALARLDFKPELTQLTGLFHAGAIIALADETATAAAMWETNPTGEFRPELFPLTLQMSVNLIKNANRGTLVAEAELAKFVATLLAPAPPAVTAPADRPGR
jgi:uncharacterized protein (TIGR00369 family)